MRERTRLEHLREMRKIDLMEKRERNEAELKRQRLQAERAAYGGGDRANTVESADVDEILLQFDEGPAPASDDAPNWDFDERGNLIRRVNFDEI